MDGNENNENIESHPFIHFLQSLSSFGSMRQLGVEANAGHVTTQRQGILTIIYAQIHLDNSETLNLSE